MTHYFVYNFGVCFQIFFHFCLYLFVQLPQLLISDTILAQRLIHRGQVVVEHRPQHF